MKDSDKKTLHKLQKAAHREAIIEAGLYGVHINKVHRDKNKYNRKNKHKRKDWE